jgi:DNA polymerase III sliding clamp (beta) subunit (PCNA family)
VKPLLSSKLESFLKRFDNFRGGELRSIKVISTNTILVTIAGQDSAREFDWISMAFEFNVIIDAKLLEEEKLKLIDMSDGISIINTNNKFAFAIGECYNISSIKNSTCHIISSSLKHEEGLF